MRHLITVVFVSSLLLASTAGVLAQVAPAAEPTPWVQTAALAVEAQMITWRRHIHQNPELGNQEVHTAAYVADHLAALGLEVHSGIAGTGLVAVLQGELPGPVVALRADMDALPGKEDSDLPFASQAKGTYFGQEVDVMHACGHDAHTAMLMGTASVLAANRDKVPGTVVFIFQPAEEGPSDIDVFTDNTTWGARRIVEEDVLATFGVQAIFGIHVASPAPAGVILYKVGTAMSSADSFRITLTGTQTHGAMPWAGNDPIVAGAQVINSLQTLVSRRADLTLGTAVVSVGSIHAGTAGNIVPGELVMEGTIRSNSAVIRETLTMELPALVEQSAAAQRVSAKVDVVPIAPLTINDPELTRAMVPALQRAALGNAVEIPAIQTTSEDFSYYANAVPGLFVFLGATPAGQNPATAPVNHHPAFFVDEATLITGVRSHVEFVLEYARWQSAI